MKLDTLTRNNDFSRAYRRGKSFVHHHVVLYVNKNRVGKTRVGITTSKKIGNAVTRNRARRVIRHALAATLPAGGFGGVDLVLVARGQTPRLKSTRLAETLQKLFAQAQLVPGGNSAKNTQPNAKNNAEKNRQKNTPENMEKRNNPVEKTPAGGIS